MKAIPYSGGRIGQPGVYVGLDLETYHTQICTGPSVSSSGLRTIWNESPAHFWAKSDLNPRRIPREAKAHFALGQAAHQLLLEGSGGFAQTFAVRPDRWSDWRTKDAQMWREDAMARGLTVLTPGDLEIVEGMAESLRAHPLVAAGILDGDIERSIIAKDPETGIWLKSRPDVIPNHSGDLADLKTTASVATDDLRRAIADYGYHQQAALAADVLEATTGVKLETFSLVWIEKAPPFCVRVTTLTAEDILRGQMQNRAALRMMARCLDSGVWPGPGGITGDAEFLSVPAWAAKTIDERLEVLKETDADEPTPRITELEKADA